MAYNVKLPSNFINLVKAKIGDKYSGIKSGSILKFNKDITNQNIDLKGVDKSNLEVSYNMLDGGVFVKENEEIILLDLVLNNDTITLHFMRLNGTGSDANYILNTELGDKKDYEVINNAIDEAVSFVELFFSNCEVTGDVNTAEFSEVIKYVEDGFNKTCEECANISSTTYKVSLILSIICSIPILTNIEGIKGFIVAIIAGIIFFKVHCITSNFISLKKINKERIRASQEYAKFFKKFVVDNK